VAVRQKHLRERVADLASAQHALVDEPHLVPGEGLLAGQAGAALAGADGHQALAAQAVDDGGRGHERVAIGDLVPGLGSEDARGFGEQLVIT